MKLSYNAAQVDYAVAFLLKYNPHGKNFGDEHIKKAIMDFMVELAHGNKYSTIATMGFIVCGGTYYPESVPLANREYLFQVYVDASVGVDYEAGEMVI